MSFHNCLPVYTSREMDQELDFGILRLGWLPPHLMFAQHFLPQEEVFLRSQHAPVGRDGGRKVLQAEKMECKDPKEETYPVYFRGAPRGKGYTVWAGIHIRGPEREAACGFEQHGRDTSV